MEPLISVILPIYKVEKYLCRAVDSVLAQTYSNLEIILVEDGSPDDCGRICDAYVRKDKRIQVIHKENGGLSDARNAGLDHMKGEYVVFVDSDDYIAPFFVEELFESLTETGADVSFSQYAVVKQEDNSEEEKLRRPHRAEFPTPQDLYVYDRKKLLLNMYDCNHPDATYFIVSWNKLYKASLWDGVRFPTGKIHEDEATTYRIFDKAKLGVYVKAPMYAYFSAPSSITRDTFSMKRLDWMDALSDRILFFRETQEHDLVAAALRARADGAIHYYYPLCEHVKDVKEVEAAKARLRFYIREALGADKKYHTLSAKTKAGYHLFLNNPGLYRRILGGLQEKKEV